MNLVRKVLEGFAKSSTKSFNEFCASQIALRRESFYQTLMKNTSLQNQLNNVLNNLKTSYLDLVGGKLWAGVNSSPQGSAFIAGSGYKDKVEHAQAMAAMKNMPWDEWVKLYAKCHHCGEKDHIRPDCPKYLQQINSGKIVRGPKYQRSGPHGPPLSCPPGREPPRSPGHAEPPRDFMKEPKAKAFLSAFQALFTNDKNNNEEEDESNDEQDGDADNNQGVDDDVRVFLSLAGSLKD